MHSSFIAESEAPVPSGTDPLLGEAVAILQKTATGSDLLETITMDDLAIIHGDISRIMPQRNFDGGAEYAWILAAHIQAKLGVKTERDSWSQASLDRDVATLKKLREELGLPESCQITPVAHERLSDFDLAAMFRKKFSRLLRWQV